MCRIMYTDTDSLIYHVKCEDVYKNMKRNIAKFDTSDYAIDNAYGIPLENKKVPGLMKDENNDALSRLNSVDLPTITSTQEIANAQEEDEELQTLFRSDSALKLKRLRVDDSEDVIYCDVSTPEIRPYIPKSLRRRIFDVVHNCSHPSGRATKKHIQKRFVWPSMAKDVTDWARTCLACQRSKISRHAYHPASNGIIERWHRSLKAALMCHNGKQWTKLLPTVLLGLRTSIKGDINASAAEMLYGENLTLPGEFFLDLDVPTDPACFVHHLRDYLQTDLATCSHVFVRVDSIRRPLQAPYEGPYQILERDDKVFKVSVKGQPTTVSIDRVKPAHFENDALRTPATLDQPQDAQGNPQDVATPGSNAPRVYQGP
ncbi:uncharacterized protein [Temnothorax nylanderi]|uniref:uncharacterized protein n=1 Tax=Temnothorax nylanderi TaxID=102681 RepID=UPI003A8B3770